MTVAAVPMQRTRPLLLPALATAAMLAVLIGLGLWQLHRLAWKNAILTDIALAESAPPVPLGLHPAPFTKVSTEGHLRTDLHALYGADVRGDRMGARLIEPLERPGQDTVLIDRGWVPEGREAVPATPGPVVGYVRTPDQPGLFSATDDVTRRHFYTLDPGKIGTALGLAHVAPFILVTLGSGEGIPQAATELPRPPNDHLNYALTWFGLALALLTVFGVYARKILRP